MYAIYDDNGNIIKTIKQCTDINQYIELNNYTNYHSIEANENIDDPSRYKVVNNVLIKRTSEGLSEYMAYGKELTDEERIELELLKSLIPSEKEVLMAEVEIQTITILMEVGLI